MADNIIAKPPPLDPNTMKKSGVMNMALTELWERFSFYGLQAILPFYLLYSVQQGGLDMGAAASAGIVGAYGGAVYSAQLVGAWLGDRLISPARLVLWGGVVIAAGHVALAVFNGLTGLSIGLLLIILGTGALKVNITSIMGYIVEDQDEASRDVGFSYFYMAINLGAVIGPTSTGFAQTTWGFHYGFGLAAIGMGLAVVQFAFSMKKLPEKARHVPNPLDRATMKKVWAIVIAAIVVVAVIVYFRLIPVQQLSLVTTVIALAGAVFYFGMMLASKSITAEERTRVKSFIPMFIGASIYFGLLFQVWTSIAILITKKVDLHIGGWEFPAPWVSMWSQLAAVLLTPVVAYIWIKLRHNNVGPSTKFGIGLLQIGLSYVIMIAVLFVVGEAHIWVVTILVILAIGGSSEVMVGPIGLALSTKIGPKKYHVQFVGLNFLTLALGSSMSGLFGQLFTIIDLVPYYAIIAGTGIVLGIFFFAVKKPLERGLYRAIEPV